MESVADKLIQYPFRRGRSEAPSDWLLVPVSLILGLLLTLGGILGYYLMDDRYQAKESLVWPGLPLRVLTGKIHSSRTDGLVIGGLDTSGRAAILLTGAILDSSRFNRFDLQVNGFATGIRLGLVWRDPSRARTAQVIWLPPPEQDRIELALGEQSNWRGSITELTLLVQGRLTDPLAIQRISLSPLRPGVLQFLNQLNDEWTAFTGWTQRSINFLPAGKRLGLISPVLAAALWVGASVLLYVLARWLWRGPWRLAPFVVIAMCGWLALDARWQWEFLRQLDTTRNQFAGKTGHEKRFEAEDRALYQLAQEIKEAIGQASSRLLVLPPSDEERYRYTRIRLNYFLLPLNVSTQWSTPPAAGLRAGDYLFVWAGHGGVRWDGDRQQLTWPGQDGWQAELILANPNGNLYRLR